jgi:hypothetical protein
VCVVLISVGDADDASAAFCVEPLSNATGDYCPSWASGKSTKAYSSQAGKWLTVDITSATGKKAFPFNTGYLPLNYSGNPGVK